MADTSNSTPAPVAAPADIDALATKAQTQLAQIASLADAIGGHLHDMGPSREGGGKSIGHIYNLAEVIEQIAAQAIDTCEAIEIAAPFNPDKRKTMARAVQRYEQDRDTLNDSHGLSQEEEDKLAEVYSAALTVVENITPASPLDFLRKFTAIFDNGCISRQEVRDRMIAEARTLIAAGSR